MRVWNIGNLINGGYMKNSKEFYILCALWIIAGIGNLVALFLLLTK
jgi:hypothetical protein